MKNKSLKNSKLLYLWSIIYVAISYLLIKIIAYTNADNSTELVTSPLMLPFILAIINLAIVLIFKNKISREQLLNCSILIKYCLMPLFLIGGVAIILLLCASMIAFPFFCVGPVVAGLFAILGWVIMIGSAPFSIAYIIKSYKQGVHEKVLCVIAGILQSCFFLDTIAVMILAVKEKRFIKLNITLFILLILGLLIGIVRLIALFIS